ncbi:Pkinase domain-containing protein/S_locus_glycop domain-containing protein/B_lectin domain-containing protein [Cephalotus follicularis]|uniref:Receptor-like serine/threonine-protein kinase n=1 Tax=Cephalotus follicularis TaxID=3775 RepID=A0A1Q3C6C0_CEPFO|nr:Pkinase domain-containing protein/S_locus_glycop domain-containing protein/B_lectin domain-containing protein [Cephalotus follicularis]
MILRCSLVLCTLFYITTSIYGATNIPLGSFLSASNPNQSWSSPNDTFSLSFAQVVPSTSPPSFLPSIAFFGGVPIWSPPAATVDSGGSLRLDIDGLLRLVNGSGSTVWDSATDGLGVASASIDDSGNLVLSNSTGTVWSSFQNPTDTIVPSQNLTVGQILRSGVYSFRLLSNGVQPTGILAVYDSSVPSGAIVAYSSDYGEGSDILRFLRLDSDGNLRIYSSARGSGSITERWAAIAEQCEVFGYCGNMGICSYNTTNPVCGCPSENFELIDKNDSKKGCKRKMELEDCPGNATMLELNNAKFLTYEPELSQVFSSGISACRLNCLVTVACVASTSLSDGTGFCYLKTSNFISGYQSLVLPGTSYVKVCGPVVPNPSLDMQIVKKVWRLRGWIIAVAVLSTLIVLAALEGGLWWWCCKNSPRFGALSAQYALLEYASGAPVQFSYNELQRSTKGFKQKLGTGGFGAVYRGILANKTVAAVKQLEGIEQGEKQFRMEVATISSTHHLNLVRLIGFCSEGRHRLLVYEFMKNGSLDNFLFATEEQSGKLLNWENRFNIALGTAKGITYLHEECRDCIIHCDIKPENILLDDNYNAKVSDFGLAKLINPKEHRYRTLTSVRGTRGYLAPEWLANLPITSKSDVYSYGMVLLEIVCGRRNFEVSEETNWKKFSIWAYKESEKGNVREIVDKRLADQNVDMEQVMRAIQVSFWCIQEQPSRRPMMGRVVQMLEGNLEIDKPPVPEAINERSASGTSLNVSSNVSAVSNFAASAPAPSSSSSFQTSGVSPLALGRNMERASSSLIRSDQN